MKKNIIIIVLVVICVTIRFLAFSKEEVEDGFNDLSQIKYENTLSMMLEQTAGAGDYSLETRSSWPAKEEGYIFNSTLSKCERGSKLRWDEENNIVVMVGTTSDKCYVYFDKIPTLVEWVIIQYSSQTSGSETIYLHNSSLTNGAGDNSYRYAGASDSVNNFVCFGSDEETCTDDNLYRIIGVFENQVKLIKWDYVTSTLLGTDTADYGGTNSFSSSYYQGESSNLTNIAEYYWNKANYDTSKTATGYHNDWSYSLLNKTHLNTNYLANIGSTWANKIATTTWKVGGVNSADYKPSGIYKNEITSPSTQVTSTYSSKIGLMYVSDYAFAAAPSGWTVPLDEYERKGITPINWMYMGLEEWTITRSSKKNRLDNNYYNEAFLIFDDGSVGNDKYTESGSEVVNDASIAVRPVFYLNSDVTYVSGSGTKEDSIRIN